MKKEELNLNAYNPGEYNKRHVGKLMEQLERQVDKGDRAIVVVDILVGQLASELSIGFLTKYLNKGRNVSGAVDAKFAERIIRRVEKFVAKYPQHLNHYFETMQKDPNESAWGELISNPIEE